MNQAPQSGTSDLPGDDPFIEVSACGQRTLASGAHACHINAPLEDHSSRGVLRAGWSWDGHQLDAHTDRFGMHALFYGETAAGGVVVSPSLPLVARRVARVGLNERALGVFLRLGYFLGDQLPVTGVSLLAPGGALRWREGRLHVQTPTGDVRPTYRGAVTHARAEFVRLVRECVSERSRYPAPVIVPLSGGRDSRHLFLEVVRHQRAGVEAITLEHLPPKANDDALIAAELAHRAGVPCRVVRQPASYRRAWREAVKDARTNLSTTMHGWYWTMRNALPNHAAYLYDGVAGDVLSQSSLVTAETHRLLAAGQIRQLAERLLSGDETIAKTVSPALLAQCPRTAAVEALCDELARHCTRPNPLSQFYFWNRTRRAIAVSPFRILPAEACVVTPFLDDPVYDLLASLPFEMTQDRQFHDRSIGEAFPEYCDVRYEDKRARRRRLWWLGLAPAAVGLVNFARTDARLDLTRGKAAPARVAVEALASGGRRSYLVESALQLMPYLSELQSLVAPRRR